MKRHTPGAWLLAWVLIWGWGLVQAAPPEPLFTDTSSLRQVDPTLPLPLPGGRPGGGDRAASPASSVEVYPALTLPSSRGGNSLPHPRPRGWSGGAELAALSITAPSLTLAMVYQPGLALADYWVSEKYDGFRAYWDGTRLLSRQGRVFPAPDWFIAGFPALPMDGELWLGRGQFEALASIVRQQQPHDGWREVRFMVFDLPAAGGNFTQRLAQLQQTLAAAQVPWLRAVPQWRVADEAQLLEQLDAVVVGGGEGLMLRRGTAPYQSGRSDDLLKLKPREDAEATVIGYLPGKGKYTGMMGALLVETPAGLHFRIGTGFSDAERRDPPPLGSVITYQYSGLTRHGVPRFARYLRLREAE